jgi:hypothetical protein
MVVALGALGYSHGPISVLSSDSSGVAAHSEKTLELFAGFPLSLAVHIYQCM